MYGWERIGRETLYLGDREGSPIPKGLIILVLGELRWGLGRVAGSQGRGIGCHKPLLDLVFPSSASWRKECVGHISKGLRNYPLSVESEAKTSFVV